MVSSMMDREDISTLYFDCFRYQYEDLPDYNAVKAKEFADKYPGRRIKNIAPTVAALRMWKDEDEIELVKKAIDITDKSLQFVMKNLKPGNTDIRHRLISSIWFTIRVPTALPSRRLPEAEPTEPCFTMRPTRTSARTDPSSHGSGSQI